ncbi:MAG: hypothetical protein M0Q26_06010 [Chitinophagaceae bacterium]|nr:hypothetical protein [Chitinophagaceae bacterium]MDP1763439.1 hypothetical protein [Sediminibacterium sp.]
MESYFTVTLPTKAYLKKYLEAQYGHPLIFSINSYFGQVLALVLAKNVYPDRNTAVVHKAFDKYDNFIDIKMPAKWLKHYRYGTDIDPKKAVYINKLVENKFEDELVNYCTLLDMFDIKRKDSLLDFCTRYNFEIDVDITFDSIKKMEYRYRQKNKEKYKRILSPDIEKAIQARFF